MNAVTPLLSILTVGISGSARLHEKLGASEASWAIDRSMKRVVRTIEAFGGVQLKANDDEAMASFDSVDASLQAAVEMQQRVADLPPVSGVKIAIRVGISCGNVNNDSQTVDDEVIKEAAMLAGLAKPGQILGSRKISRLISPALMPRLSDYQLPLAAVSGAEEMVLEVSVNEPVPCSDLPEQKTLDSDPSEASPRKGCLRLLYCGEMVLLNDSKTSIRLGRDSTCDIAIRDRRASRLHATIERRGNIIVLIDRSANGTYVTIDSATEQFVRHNECVLHGRGFISLAASSEEADADLVEFELT